MPRDTTVVLTATSPIALALATSQALFRHAPAVVLAGDGSDLTGASTAAASLGVPLLLTPAATTALTPAATTATGELRPAVQATPATDAQVSAELRKELERLGPATLITEDQQAAEWARTLGNGMAVVGGDATLPSIKPDPPLGDLLVLALPGASSAAALATARAAGARSLVVPNPDPRTSSDAIKALAGQPVGHVLALGAGFGPAARLRQRIDTAATGVELPGGGQVVFPGRRMVALYGHPGDSVLGVLGEQSLSGAIARAKRVAHSYSDLVSEPVVPAFEIIATVASSDAGSDGDYSAEASVASLKPWVDAARKAGIYVVLDLQPGRTDFLTQAKRYEKLLVQPHVGLALDPEWRLKKNQHHMVQIGSVRAAEVNATAAWLADLTRRHHLPQKILIVHQFRLDMISGRSSLNTSYDDLRVVIHVDGFGNAGQKLNTWHTINRGAPDGIYWGWKNFYDEDKPTFTPKQTMAVSPRPVFVSYQ